MKITPLEIRQKTFEKKLRGFDKDEVNAFLLSLSNEWERVLDENKELRIKLDQAEKEVQKLREVESSLFKTLKTAEDTGANLVDQANKAAELHMKETEINSEALLSESKSKARAIIEKAEVEARQMVEEMQTAVKDLEQNYRSIENQRENVIVELKNLSSDILDRIQRADKTKGEFAVEDHLKKVKDLARTSQDKLETHQEEVSKNIKVQKPEVTLKEKIEVVKKEETTVKALEKKSKIIKKKEPIDNGNASFFDELE